MTDQQKPIHHSSAATGDEILYAPLAKDGEFTARPLYPNDEIDRLRANVEYWRLAAERREERRERTGLDIPEARTLDAPGLPDEPQTVGEPSPCAYTGYVAQGDENVLVRIWGFGRPDASVKDVRLLYSFPPPIAGEPNARAIADAYSDWAWEKEGTPVGLMLPNESARAGFFAGAKWACSVSRPQPRTGES